MNREELINTVTKSQLKKSQADVRVGDTVKVSYRIREGNKERVQVFAGLVIATKAGQSLQGSFTVRKVVSGVGVERTFPIHSPWMLKIERVKSGKVRKARLNFVRQYALSSKFKLKDKNVAGTVWEEIAEEKADIQKEEEHESKAEVAPEEEKGEAEADDTTTPTAREDGGAAGEPTPQEPGTADSPEEQKN